jgi:transcriptional regulator with XRE-family HTH domain
VASLAQDFGRHLRRNRKRLDLSLRQLAKQARIPHSTLWFYEKGMGVPSLIELVSLARVFTGGDVSSLVALFNRPKEKAA